MVEYKVKIEAADSNHRFHNFDLGYMGFKVPLTEGNCVRISYSDEGLESLDLGVVKEVTHYPIIARDNNQEKPYVNVLFYQDNPKSFSRIEELAHQLANNDSPLPKDPRTSWPHERPSGLTEQVRWPHDKID